MLDIGSGTAFVALAEPIKVASGDRVRMHFTWQRCQLSVAKINDSTMTKERH